ncbi:MAG: type II toxin-antitoxin system RelE/ParE family toxin [Nitrospirae bacterium]|nr:type II toxin-antitoxin system RelE/ParE family toxin [Nitrospirota bacterium]
MYKVTIFPFTKKSLSKLDKIIQERITEKLVWLAENSDKIVHHPLVSLSEKLKGLCKLRVGNYRILYKVYHEESRISIFYIDHRNKVYNFLNN